MVHSDHLWTKPNYPLRHYFLDNVIDTDHIY